MKAIINTDCMKRVIVFGNDHTNSVGVIHSLGKAGYKIIGLLYGYIHGFVQSSKYTERLMSAKDPQSCIDLLLNTDFNDEGKIPIIPTCDLAALTLERNRASLSSHFVFEYSKYHSLESLAGKEYQVRLAEQIGFNVPKSWKLKSHSELPNNLIYPCIIKPLVSSSGAKSDIRICNSLEELKFNLNTLEYTRDVLIQQYIERDYEISILGCSLTTGQCILPAVENKLTLYPKYVGLECLANLQPLQDQMIRAKIEVLCKAIGYVGLFSVEMMHSRIDNKFYFTEINLRNDGAESFVTKFGANLPLNHVQDLLGLPITIHKSFKPGYYIWEMHHLQSLLCGDITIGTWLKDLLKSRGFLMSHKGDMGPFFAQFLNPICRKLKIKKGGYYQ